MSGQFGTGAEVFYGHFGTSAEMSWVRSVLGPSVLTLHTIRGAANFDASPGLAGTYNTDQVE